MQDFMRRFVQQLATDCGGSHNRLSMLGKALVIGCLALVALTPAPLAGQDADSSEVPEVDLSQAGLAVEGYGGFGGFTPWVFGVGASYPLPDEWHVYAQVSALGGDGQSGWMADVGVGARFKSSIGFLGYVRGGVRGFDLSGPYEGGFKVRPVAVAGIEFLKQRVRPFASWAGTYFEWENQQWVFGVRWLLGS
jgi:hypothetical protein